MPLPTETVLTKQFQKAYSHTGTCIFVCFILKGHLRVVAYFPSKGKSFCPCSSICCNFTLFQFPTVCCEAAAILFHLNEKISYTHPLGNCYHRYSGNSWQEGGCGSHSLWAITRLAQCITKPKNS